MDEKYLLPEEEIITKSDRNIVTLTNLRVRYSDIEFGKAHIISLLLEKVSSIEIQYRSQVALLFLSVVSAICGAIMSEGSTEDIALICFVVAIISLIIYLISRKHYLIISSDGGAKIQFHTKGMKRESVLEFANQLETAIKNRRENLK